ncbi:hypothetical protein K466DRAFT_652309, partial [Polyporus arcularius HHB13444]
MTCFQAIHSASNAYWGEQTDTYTYAMQSAHPGIWISALVAFMTESTDPNPVSATAFQAAYECINLYGQHVRSDAPQTRLACVDIARIKQHCDDATLPSDGKDIVQNLLSDFLEATVETKLGNDVRQYVASRLADQALTGLVGTSTDDSDTMRALRAMQCIVQCVPLPDTPDYKHDGPEYIAVRSQAVRSLEAFAS